MLERKQRRATWFLQAKAKREGKPIESVRSLVSRTAGAAGAGGAAETADAGSARLVKKMAAADKKAKAEAAAAQDAADRAAVAAVATDPVWEPVVQRVENLSRNGKEMLGIPDETDSTQNMERYRKRKARTANPETYEQAAARAFKEMTRPLSIRGLMG